MIVLPETEEALNRLSHTLSHVSGPGAREGVNRALDHIAKGTGSLSGCLRSLMSYANASAVVSCFKNGDVSTSKKWAYVRAYLQYFLTTVADSEDVSPLAFELRAMDGLFYLLSENSDLICWYSGFDRYFDVKRTNNPKKADYWTKNFFVALRGEWSVLAERCEYIIANPPTGSREKKFIIDHRFYEALAKGNVDEMNSIIEELVSVKMVRRRAALEGGYSSELFCTPAIIYSKLAIRNGYEIQVESPYLPRPWLSTEPPDAYPDPYEFLRTENVLG